MINITYLNHIVNSLKSKGLDVTAMKSLYFCMRGQDVTVMKSPARYERNVSAGSGMPENYNYIIGLNKSVLPCQDKQ